MKVLLLTHLIFQTVHLSQRTTERCGQKIATAHLRNTNQWLTWIAS